MLWLEVRRKFFTQGNLSKVMQAFQTSYTVYFNKRRGRSAQITERALKAADDGVDIG
ncbi:MAG TPA: hypothetical protein VLX11_13805 [Candidatus Acidoferrales bacterium]|nr:hypothetical protein [Candidatus Acidoferrales bacterium]